VAIESHGTSLLELPDVHLPDLNGSSVSLRAYAANRRSVVVFSCNHCPYVQSIESRLGDIARQFDDVAWFAICSNDTASHPDDDVPGLRIQAARAHWTFPYLVDESQEVAQAFGAVCTPDFFVFNAAHQLVYRGAMDDARPRQPQPIDAIHLLGALEAASENRAYSNGKPAMGCGIKWKEVKP
jgi:peroxiredoxin